MLCKPKGRGIVSFVNGRKTVGPKDLLGAKEWIDVEYLTSCGGNPAHQKFPLRLAIFGPICAEIPPSIMRLAKGTCYVEEVVAVPWSQTPDYDGIYETLEEIRAKEEK